MSMRSNPAPRSAPLPHHAYYPTPRSAPSPHQSYYPTPRSALPGYYPTQLSAPPGQYYYPKSTSKDHRHLDPREYEEDPPYSEDEFSVFPTRPTGHKLIHFMDPRTWLDDNWTTAKQGVGIGEDVALAGIGATALGAGTSYFYKTFGNK